jgi:addiction module HigA family antidote
MNIPLENFFSETLRETLEQVSQSQEQIANDTGIPKQHLSEMKLGKRRCTVEYDLRLSRYFGTTNGFWLRLQLDYDLMKVEREKGKVIQKEVHPAA